jgi:hypothetical protein
MRIRWAMLLDWKWAGLATLRSTLGIAEGCCEEGPDKRAVYQAVWSHVRIEPSTAVHSCAQCSWPPDSNPAKAPAHRPGVSSASSRILTGP